MKNGSGKEVEVEVEVEGKPNENRLREPERRDPEIIAANQKIDNVPKRFQSNVAPPHEDENVEKPSRALWMQQAYVNRYRQMEAEKGMTPEEIKEADQKRDAERKKHFVDPLKVVSGEYKADNTNKPKNKP